MRSQGIIARYKKSGKDSDIWARSWMSRCLGRSDRRRYWASDARQMLRRAQVPELEHKKTPKNAAIIGHIVRSAARCEPFREILPKVAALTSGVGAQDVEHIISQRMMLVKPDAEGQAKSVLFFRQNLLWQNTSHGLLE